MTPARVVLVVAFTSALIGACSGATTGSGAGSSSDCSPVNGRYQRGKGGGAPACCAGLREQSLPMRATAEDGSPICTQPPGHAEFTCVRGTCGDGVCEPGEDVPCGCAADCPSARVSGSGPDAAASCSRDGPYGRGKGPFHPPPCCLGLHEVPWGYPTATDDGGKTCRRPGVFFYYSCVKGSCGDGICEPGENHECGCAADCPGVPS